jgi:hypothetical protein
MIVLMKDCFRGLHRHLIIASRSHASLPWFICHIFSPIIAFETSAPQYGLAGSIRHFSIQLLTSAVVCGSACLGAPLEGSGNYTRHLPLAEFCTDVAVNEWNQLSAQTMDAVGKNEICSPDL